MQNARITVSDVTYRLFRNRRGLVTSVFLAAISLALSILLGGPDTFFAAAGNAGAALLGWSLLMALLLVRYPNGWVDPLAFSLALIPFVSATPLYEYLLAMADPDRKIIGAIWLTFLVLFGWFFTYLGINQVTFAWLPRIKLGERRVSSRVSCPLPAETVFSALVPAPDRDDAMQSTGPVEADGFFRSDTEAQMPDTDTFELGDWSSSSRMKILQQDGLSQTTLCVLEHGDGKITTSVQVESCRDVRGECIYESHEVHDHFDLMAALGWWFQDAGADYTLARLDQMQGKRPRANRMAHYDTILTSLARYIVTKDAENQPPY